MKTTIAPGRPPRLRGELIRPTSSIRLAVIDADSGFVRVLSKRLEGAGWQHRTLPAPVPVEDLVAMRLNAIVVDLALFGPRAWEFLESVSRDLPGLGVVVVTEQSTVAQRVRGLRLSTGNCGQGTGVRKSVLCRSRRQRGGQDQLRRLRLRGLQVP